MTVDSRSAPRPSRASSLRPWRELFGSDSVGAMIGVVRRYGWLSALLGLFAHGATRGVFEYFANPFVVIDGYLFDGWPIALFIDLVYGTALVTMSWFLYFGAIGVLAGYLSTDHIMETDVFKVGGYLSVLFVPVFLVGTAVIATVTAPEGMTAAAIERSDVDVAMVSSAYSFVYDSAQMQVVQTLKAATWIATGFLMLPVVGELYDLEEKRCVAAVLPVTLAAVVAAFLL